MKKGRKTTSRLADLNKAVYSRDMTHWYHVYNRRYFKKQFLPNIEVYFGPLKAPKGKIKFGCTGMRGLDPIYIVLNKKLEKFGECFAHLILLHEMVHAYIPRADHGPKFRKEIHRLAVAGAFNDLVG